jgi:hypothetical protein
MSKKIAYVSCKCKHEFQDRLYGARVRVANLAMKSVKGGSESVDVRCTVCGVSHTINSNKLR